MLKIFLVEDEIVMREGIKNNIDWEREGFDFVGEASDGELAYPLIQKTHPDILITDIRMPFMDGLELSGYDEFEYAKEAISIGITDYLVKPIGGAQLLEAVKKVAQVVEEEKQQRQFLETFQKFLLRDVILNPQNKAVIGNRSINFRSVNGMAVYQKDIPGFQMISFSFYVIGGFSGKKNNNFMKIMIMPGKFPAGLIFDMKKPEFLIQIPGFLGLIKLIGQQHLRFLLSEG